MREQAVRMVQEHRGEHPSLWAAIESVAPTIVCVPQTLHEWGKRDEVDAGASSCIKTAHCEEINALEHEVKEFGRANEILKLASDNARAETINGAYKTGLVHRKAPSSARGEGSLCLPTVCCLGAGETHARHPFRQSPDVIQVGRARVNEHPPGKRP